MPREYFVKACGALPRWHLEERHSEDLVPVEQAELVQDALELKDLHVLTSADARACVSLCRPYGHFVDKRRLHARSGVISTQSHQSGTLSLRPLTPEGDVARGMLSGLVAKKSYLATHFTLREQEKEVLPLVLQWLQASNPWLQAYASSLTDVTKCWEFCEQLAEEGRLMAQGPVSATTASGPPVAEQLDDEEIAIFVPVDDLKSLTGSFGHMRVELMSYAPRSCDGLYRRRGAKCTRAI